jgi:hypothetical protein
VSSAISAPSRAQTDQSESVIVTGRLDQPTLATEIRRFVRGHARLTRIRQLARWDDPVCPRVIGLPAAYGDFIVTRIKTVAREAGAPTNDAADCTANITIIFTAEPQPVLDHVRSERPELLGYHFIGQRGALATMTRPIQAWHVTATNDVVDEAMSDPPPGVTGSRLSTGLESTFIHVLILVNQSEVADAPIGPISDYIAMLALTDVRDETWTCGGLVTIMERFSSCGAAPQELTTPDRAFLQGLYSMTADAVLALERAHIAREMREAITSEPALSPDDPQ